VCLNEIRCEVFGFGSFYQEQTNRNAKCLRRGVDVLFIVILCVGVCGAGALIQFTDRAVTESFVFACDWSLRAHRLSESSVQTGPIWLLRLLRPPPNFPHWHVD